MSAFRFPLQKVLEHREREERERAKGLSDARADADAAQKARSDLAALREIARHHAVVRTLEEEGRDLDLLGEQRRFAHRSSVGELIRRPTGDEPVGVREGLGHEVDVFVGEAPGRSP